MHTTEEGKGQKLHSRLSGDERRVRRLPQMALPCCRWVPALMCMAGDAGRITRWLLLSFGSVISPPAPKPDSTKAPTRRHICFPQVISHLSALMPVLLSNIIIPPPPRALLSTRCAPPPPPPPAPPHLYFLLRDCVQR